MGDPAGIGPEVIVRAWRLPALHAFCQPLVIGHPDVLRRAAKQFAPEIQVEQIAEPEKAAPSPALLPCLNACRPDAADAAPGVVSASAGQAAYDALICAADLALSGRVDALTTAPLNKAALWAAGRQYPGHTELLAERCGVTDFAMMLYLARDESIKGSGGLGVIHVTLHVALRQVFGLLSPEAILAKIKLADAAMRLLKGSAPSVGVCALNPHAGETGLFGDEEQTIIGPAVESARHLGILAEGPFPADTLMVRARGGEFDAVVAMYHDQGHIALKLLGWDRAVNVTLGLPIIRTSVAHGTAFDKAWQGRADVNSMIEAARVASQLANYRTAPLTSPA